MAALKWCENALYMRKTFSGEWHFFLRNFQSDVGTSLKGPQWYTRPKFRRDWRVIFSAIYHYPVDRWISIGETNYTIYWREIYPLDTAIHLLNNWGQEGNSAYIYASLTEKTFKEKMIYDERINGFLMWAEMNLAFQLLYPPAVMNT